MENDRELLEMASKATGLKIYLISWSKFGGSLSAVVAANNEDEALNMLDLSEYAENIKCICVGLCDANISRPDVLCRESF